MAPDVDGQSLQIAGHTAAERLGEELIPWGLVKHNFGSDSVYTGKRRATPLQQLQHCLGTQIIKEYLSHLKYKVVLSTLF